MEAKNDFFDRVYEIVKLIPEGKLCTYGLIAKAIGSPSGARMVGWAMNKSLYQKESIPAHRVLNRNGLLTGKQAFGNPFMMQELLEAEGHHIVNDGVVDFESKLWNPLIELD